MRASNMEISLVAMDCRDAIQDGATAEDNARAAMMVAKDHWMVLNRDLQFKGVLSALLAHYKEGPEFDRIESEIKAIGRLNAVLVAAQAGLSVNLPEDDPDEPKHEPIGLIAMWQEVLKKA